MKDLELFCRYLAELLAERQKLGPFLQVLPFCCRLLNQGIFSYSGKTLKFISVILVGSSYCVYVLVGSPFNNRTYSYWSKVLHYLTALVQDEMVVQLSLFFWKQGLFFFNILFSGSTYVFKLQNLWPLFFQLWISWALDLL